MRSVPFLDNLNDAVRDNPVAAGLIGLGLAWMVLGKSGAVVRDTSGVARAAKRTMDTAVDLARGPAASGVVDHVRKAAADVSDAVSETVQVAGSRIGDAMERLKSSSPDPGTQSEFGRHFPLPPANRLADLLNRQPLALAAVGVAVGAAIASALPPTSVEGRLIGTAGEKLRETMADAADTVADKAVSAIEAATDEAVAQGLTPDAAKHAVQGAAAKLKTVADAGLEALEK